MENKTTEEFIYNEEIRRWECALAGDCDVEILFNKQLNRYEIRVGDEDYQRVYYSKYEPGVKDRRNE
jgi:hypothetical protein